MVGGASCVRRGLQRYFKEVAENVWIEIELGKNDIINRNMGYGANGTWVKF